MRTACKWLWMIMLTALLVLLTGYLMLSLYYADGFSYGTWINGIYCTGKSASEVNVLLMKKNTYDGLKVTAADGSVYQISPSEINLRADYTQTLQTYMDQQNPFAWGVNLFIGRQHTVLPVVTYDRDQLDGIISGWSLFALQDNKRDVTIVHGKNGYELQDTTENVPVKSKVTEAVQNALMSLNTELQLQTDSDCYKNLEKTDLMQSIMKTADKLQKLQDFDVIYVFGDEQTEVSASVVSGWIVTEQQMKQAQAEEVSGNKPGSGWFLAAGKEIRFPSDARSENGFATDAEGNLLVSESAMYADLQKICEPYNTVGKTRNFSATSGRMVNISGGTYGNAIDLPGEFVYLKNALIAHKKERHTPEFSKQARATGSNDIGNTYIEIDMGEQRLYYYEESRLVITMPVVTGNIKKHRSTPEGVYYIYSKARDRVLRGQGYASFVHYWMAVYKGVGIHDATWRDEFGGEIYETGGSHGCINGPEKQVRRLYQMVQVGTPVVLFN